METEPGEGKEVMYVAGPNREVVYCLNRKWAAPETSGTGGYQDVVIKTEDLANYVGKKTDTSPITTAALEGEALKRKLIDVILAGYGNGENKYGITNAQFRAATQYAVWYYTDQIGLDDCSYFLGRVDGSVDVKSERICTIVANWDKRNEEGTFGDAPLTEDEKALIAKAEKVISAYEQLKNAPAQTESFYQHHTLHIYATDAEITKEFVEWENGKESVYTATKPYQNFAGIKTIVEDPKKEVEFSKTSVNGTKELPGAELTVSGTDSKGFSFSESWTSTNEVHKIKLYPGTYTMTENQAPLGYYTTESIDFRITEDMQVEIKNGDSYEPQSVSRIHMEDEPKTATVKFSKVEVNKTEELPGAKLKIENDEGKVVEEWTSTDKVHEIKNLAFGEYKMIEITAPDGYEVAESIEFRVYEENGQMVIQVKENGSWVNRADATVQMKDAPTPKKPEEPKTPEQPKPEEPKKPEDPKPEEPKPETPSNNNLTPTPTPNNPTVLGVTRTEENVEQIADPAQAAVLGSRRSPETADPAPLTTLVVLAGSSLVGILTLLVVWHDANHAPKKKRR